MRKLFICILAATLLLGCDSNRPNAANFTKAINALIDKPYCLPTLLDHMGQTTSVVTGPFNLDNTYEKIGFYKLTRHYKNNFNQDIEEFQLTDLGARNYQPVCHGFAFAKRKVDKIVKWTEPATTTTNVWYTYKLVDVAVWSNDPSLRNSPYIRNALANQGVIQGPIQMQLTNNGWEASQ